MAASSPKKSTAKRAPAKAAPKTPAAKSQAAREHRVDRFEQLRARVGDLPEMKVEDPSDRGPFILGPDYGFDPALVVEWPTDITTQLIIDEASRADDPLGILRAIVGRNRFYAITRVFDTTDDPLPLLIGLSQLVAEHFLGPGVDEVGGTPAS